MIEKIRTQPRLEGRSNRLNVKGKKERRKKLLKCKRRKRNKSKD